MFNPLNLLPQLPFVGPPLPRGVGLTWKDAADTVKGETGGLLRSLTPAGEPLVLPDFVYLTFKSISSAAADATIAPGALAKWLDVIEKRVAAEGKFPQFAVLYLNVSPPPAFWDYKCFKCRAWMGSKPTVGAVALDGIPAPPVTENTCKWVDGRISPAGWCGLWAPPDDYKKFTWPQELLKGDW